MRKIAVECLAASASSAHPHVDRAQPLRLLFGWLAAARLPAPCRRRIPVPLARSRWDARRLNTAIACQRRSVVALRNVAGLRRSLGAAFLDAALVRSRRRCRCISCPWSALQPSIAFGEIADVSPRPGPIVRRCARSSDHFAVEIRRQQPDQGAYGLCDRLTERASSPAPFAVAAHLAAPVVRIVGEARQQLAGAGRFDDGNGAVRSGLRPFGIERHQEVQALAGVGVDDGEERRVR